MLLKKRDHFPQLEIRYTQLEDAPHVQAWLSDPATLRWFPMGSQREVDDAAPRWVSFCQQKCSLTAVYNGVPCGIATLFLQQNKKLLHQCMHTILVAKEWRNKGIGTALMEDTLTLAKEDFHLELVHLELFEGCPALALYQKFGFKEFGRQARYVKDNQEYLGRILIEKFL